MSKSKLIYEDVAPNASRDATFSAEGAYEHSNPELLLGHTEPNYITNELNHWKLNGTFVDYDNEEVFWTGQADANGNITNCKITIDFTALYSSQGITLEMTDVAKEVEVTWYQGASPVANKTFYPTSKSYFCERKTTFNKIEILLKKALPYTRVRLMEVIFGVYRTYGMDKLRSVKITNESDLSSLSTPISNMTWVLEEEKELTFQTKQPVLAYYNDQLIGAYYVDGSSRKSNRLYEITCIDAMGILDNSNIQAQVVNNKLASVLLEEIIGDEYEIDFDITDMHLTGILGTQSKRNAIQQVALACRACVATDGARKIRIFKPSVAYVPITADRTFFGTSIDAKNIVTEVQLYSHEYTEDEQGSIIIGDKKYIDTRVLHRKLNPSVTANEKANVIVVEDGTLVSEENVVETLDFIYSYYMKRSTIKAKYVWDGEKLGDNVKQATPWGTDATGYTQRMDIVLSNIVAVTSESISTGYEVTSEGGQWQSNEIESGEN